MSAIYSLIFVVSFIAFLAVFAFVANRIICWHYNRKEKIQRQKYPDFYLAIEKRDKLFHELWVLREDYETIPKEHIDTLSQNEKYVRLVDRARHQEQLEYWREVIADHAEEIERKSQECSQARDEVNRLAELYKIK